MADILQRALQEIAQGKEWADKRWGTANEQGKYTRLAKQT